MNPSPGEPPPISTIPQMRGFFLLALLPMLIPVETRLVLVKAHPEPVITTRSRGAEGNKYGFEGGRVVKIGRTYHLFSSEVMGDIGWGCMCRVRGWGEVR